MSSLGGFCSVGNRSRSARTVSIVSSTLSVVCESHTTFSGSRTVTASTSAAVSTSWMCDGASPAVPSTSSWPRVPDEQDVEVLAGEPLGLLVHLGDQRAGGVDRAQLPVAGLGPDRGRDAVRGEHQQGTLGHLGRVVDEDRAALLERLHDVPVVHDLLADVDRRAVLLERLLDGLDGAVDAGAVAAGRGEQDALGGRVTGAGRDLRSGHGSRVRTPAGVPRRGEPGPGLPRPSQRG